MKLLTATIVPMVLGALAANCGGGVDERGAAGAEARAGVDREVLGVDGSVGHAESDASSAEKNDADKNDSQPPSSESTSAPRTVGEQADDERDAAVVAHGGDGTGGTATGQSESGTDATAGCAGVSAGGRGGDVTPAINAVAWLQPDSCARSVEFEVRDVRDQDGVPVEDYTCAWTFSDGGVSDTCAGTKSFGDLPNSHHGTVTVRDSVSGATTTATSEAVRVIEPQALELFVQSTDCMHFSYDVDRQYGCGGIHVLDIQPAGSILTPGPWSIHSQTLQVSTPGVYTVEYTVNGCAAAYARTCVTSTKAHVNVAACP